MAAVMGGHFFCLPLADGECRGDTAPMHGLPTFVYSLQNMCVFFVNWEN